MNICEKCKYLNRDTKMCEFWRVPACAHNACCGFSVQTNADRIRAMTDEELARFLASVENRRSAAGGGARWCGMAHALNWLQHPAEEVNT